jgi:inosine/xanthosine triphosphatase
LTIIVDMKVAVGTKNPVKITAVTTHIHHIWPKANIISVSVPTGVSEMPMSDDETIRGATNRAIAARKAIDAELGIGLEGGVHPHNGGLILHGWVVIVDRNGRQGIGGAARLPLPQAITTRILAGEELGPVMDDILNDHNTRQKGGAVGALTNGLAVRGDAFALAVAYALAPFVSPALYD